MKLVPDLQHSHRQRVSLRKCALALISLLFLISMACNLPSMANSAQAPTATLTASVTTPLPTAGPTTASRPRPNLPPMVVEASPQPGSDAPLKGPFTLVFSQPMDKPSVESAIQAQPAQTGKFTWKDDATLTFIPDQPFLPSTPISFIVNTTARATNGLGLPAPVTLDYTTTGPLHLTQALPENGAKEVAPDSAIVAAFNNPVVALGDSTGPAAFTIDPAVKGRGEWLNTSTYIFYPDPSLAGGSTYKVRLNPDLTSTGGAHLDKDTPLDWSFATTFPRIDLVQPESPDFLRLDGPVTVRFNIAMDPASTESGFSLAGPGGQNIPGQFTWNNSHTQLAFKPKDLLDRNATYTVTIKGTAQARGGVGIGKDFSANLSTFPALRVTGSTPGQNQTLSGPGGFDAVQIFFNAPVKSNLPNKWFSFSPELTSFNAYPNETGTQLTLNAYFQPDTTYTLTVSADLQDAWGQPLGQPFQVTFNTPPAQPNLTLALSQLGTQVAYLTPQDNGLGAQATNLTQVQGTRGSLPLEDFFHLVGLDGYSVNQSYTPKNPVSWMQSLKLASNRTEDITLMVGPDGKPLLSGLYYMIYQSRQVTDASPTRAILVVSPIQLTFKIGANQAMVWAVDLNKNQLLSGAPITIFDQNGATLVTGNTDGQGIFQADIPVQKEVYQTFYAMSGSPGSDNFGMALSSWNQGNGPWEFGISTDYALVGTMAYLYTDRPIYRPGQEVNFRGVIRKANNGRYSLADLGQVTVKIYGDSGMGGEPLLLSTQNLAVSPYGTINGNLKLADDANPGYYRIQVDLGADLQNPQLYFQVANYRKPQLDIQVSLSPTELKRGQPVEGQVTVHYFFGAPAGDIPVSWTLTRTNLVFNLPGYQVGPLDTGWLSPRWYGRFGSGAQDQIINGQDRTGPDGTLTISVPPDLLQSDSQSLQQLTLEVTATDEGGLPVSKRAVASLHPEDYYIGIKPDVWSSPAGKAVGFTLQTSDWKDRPSGNRALEAQFSRVTWVEQDSNNPLTPPTLVPEKAPIGSASPVTGADGQARLSFTPPDAGTYMLEVTGGNARSEIMAWISGPGDPAWPDLPNQRLKLTADLDQYQPGQTAQVFIPNPFGPGAMALVSVERGRVMRTQVINLTEGGYTLALPLTEDDAPNVFLSVTLLGKDAGGYPDFRQGYLTLPVEPSAQTLKVDLTAQPEKAVPGQNLTLTVKVGDSSGKPVQGEFSLALVDKAVLALADPNSLDILSAFYGAQPLGIRTGLTLGGYARRVAAVPPGMGGGGDGAGVPVVRENFPDTAYWNAAIQTGMDGTAQVSFPLPDNLTTWQADLRGLTSDTRVGEATIQVVTSKDLLIRPQTPLFMVLGDHVEMAAIVNNNTSRELQVDVTLQATGFTLDDAAQALQKVTIPANGRVKVAWWGTAQDLPAADLLFSAQSGDLKDASRPDLGKLPIFKYVSPQTYSTSGILAEGGDRLELIGLPRSFTPTGGELHLELSPSLATAMFASLEAVNNDQTDYTTYTTSILSHFLPDLEASRALKDLGIDNSDLQARLDHNVTSGVFQLLNQQNIDGGWSWTYAGQDPNVKSDPYITSYILFGLTRASQAGVKSADSAIERAQKYLMDNIGTPNAKTDAWVLDQLAFEMYALQVSGQPIVDVTQVLYDERGRLAPASQAFLALTLNAQTPGTDKTKTLLSDLQSKAVRSATGAHWESPAVDYHTPGTPIYHTAVVLYALAQQDPANPLLIDTLRYLMAHRNSENMWDSLHDSAWVLMALAQSLKGTGDLQASFAFSATLNDSPLVSGSAGGPNALTPVTASVPLSSLFKDGSNALRLSRDPGAGRLYYRADLQVNQPAENAPALQQGLSLERSYYLTGQDCTKVACQPVSEVKLDNTGQGKPITVRLSLTLPHAMYNLVVVDNIPAGAEIFNPRLKTSQQGLLDQSTGIPELDSRDPFGDGWGWWWFDSPKILDSQVTWTTNYLPAGTYELTYILIPVQAGEFRAIPARAWQYFFPEVQGTSAGSLFKISR